MVWFKKLPLLVLALVIAGGMTSSLADDNDLKNILASKISFETKAGPLHFVLGALEEKIKESHADFRIEIVGEDLQKEGITKNQRMGRLSFEDETIEKILTAIVVQANPRSGLKGPGDSRQILVWAVGPTSDKKKMESSLLIVTTRQGVKERELKLPEAFVAK